MKVAVVGAGRQGFRRVQAIQDVGEDEIVIVADSNRDAAEALGCRVGCSWSTNWQSVLDGSVDAVIICTPPRTHDEIARNALRAGRHVLCEKPLATTLAAASEMVAEAERSRRVLKCGFNYRFHPAIAQARALVESGRLGRLAALYCLHGTGGRLGFEHEWRTRASESGGGIVMDQGVHVLDLFRWFAGPFRRVIARTATAYWPISPVEDNAVAAFSGERVLATFHVSWTQWKNTFLLTLVGSEGSLSVEGLGGSYGDERLIVRPGNDQSGTIEVTEHRGSDRSWEAEWREFTGSIAAGRDPSGCGWDGAEAMRLVEGVYRSAQEGRAIELEASSKVGVKG